MDATTLELSREALAAAVAQGAIFGVRSPDFPLTLYCYTRRCMYDGLWTPLTMAARGLVISDVGEIVCSPMPKFFNLYEPNVPGYPMETLEDEPVVLLEKLDGTLINVWHYDGFWQITTKGSFTATQAALAREVVASQYGQAFFSALDPAYTYGFELIHPANRIIVDYGSRSELVLLSVRYTATGEDVAWSAVQSIALLAGVPVPKTFAGMSLRNLSLPDAGFEEGIVAWFPRLGHRVKAKRAEYLQAHRVLSGLGPRMILDLMEAQRLEVVRHAIPVQYYDQFDDIVARVHADSAQIRAQANACYERLRLAQTAAPGTPWSRKDQALWVQQQAPKELHALLFAMLDGKPIGPIIASRLRASYRTVPAVAVVEDDA